jgi:hypothetical protein
MPWPYGYLETKCLHAKGTTAPPPPPEATASRGVLKLGLGLTGSNRNCQDTDCAVLFIVDLYPPFSHGRGGSLSVKSLGSLGPATAF